MNYLSVCSGIEAATVAWHDLGFNPVAFSEIEKFPSEVLAHHYPNVPNVGDMTKYKEWNLDTIRLLVGGTPCQSFSVAGLRKGLDDPRGNLALTYVGILDKFRPKWFIWENVPGVLSSSGGRDFGSFLGAVVELGYGFAYRVLDAQYFGVPQRRRRVFVVGCSSGWKFAAKVLFESESLSRNIEKSKKSGKEITNSARTSIGALCARDYKGVGSQYVEEGKCIVQPIGFPSGMSGTQCAVAKGISPTLQSLNRTAIAFGAFGKEISDTVTSKFSKGAELLQQGAQNGGNCVLQPIAIQDTSGRDKAQNGKGWSEKNTSYTLDVTGLQGVSTNLSVRRLTPIECERLQGFPDNYTNIKENCPDGNRYKALGNSMAVPVMRWIGKRIKEIDKL
jgi:DNA (cytosine-5)-methyltransferase 1